MEQDGRVGKPNDPSGYELIGRRGETHVVRDIIRFGFRADRGRIRIFRRGKANEHAHKQQKRWDQYVHGFERSVHGNIPGMMSDQHTYGI